MKLRASLGCILFAVTAFAMPGDQNTVLHVTVPKALRNGLKSFEPSSGIYLPDLGRYLVASDDTTDNDDPWLFLMDENGQVAPNPVAIRGVKKMTDIESISQDADGSIYVLSSQSLKKNGEEKKQRDLFVRAKLGNGALDLQEGIVLRPILLQALETSSDPVLAQMRGRYHDLLDVESHFVKDGELYIGMKEPQIAKSHAVIVHLGKVSDVFAGRVSARVWNVLNFETADGLTNRLSEMTWKGQELWVTSTSDEGVGHLWRASPQDTTRVMDFPGAHPEGVGFKPDGKGFVFFDQGNSGDGLFLKQN